MDTLSLAPFPSPVNVFGHLADQLTRNVVPPLPETDENVVWLRWLAQQGIEHWDPVVVLALGRCAINADIRKLFRSTIEMIEAEIAAG